jgi:hypothetical protein
MRAGRGADKPAMQINLLAFYCSPGVRLPLALAFPPAEMNVPFVSIYAPVIFGVDYGDISLG